jgi:DNA recombination protein RmuC
MALPLLVGLLVGVILGGAIGLLVHLVARSGMRSELRTAELRLADREAALAPLRDELEGAHASCTELEREHARLSEQLEQARRSAADQQEAWQHAQQQLANEFARLSAEALSANNERFLALAGVRLQTAQEAAASDLARRQQAVASLVDPLREQLGRCETELRQLEQTRQGAYRDLLEKVGQLETTHKDLQRETRNLSSALRSPSTRGRWGELQLRKVVEMAGMLQHCDFDVQVSTGSDGDRLRPDMVVHLPGAKHVVVDAKVPLEAFQSALSCDDDDERRLLLNQHARQVRSHIESLAKKEYWRRFDPSPEFVVAFVPGDPLLTAAFEHDAGLIEFAVANHVLPATPTTLISLLWAVAYGWQQDALADNARTVQRLGTELYQRLATLGDHVSRLGRSLGSSVRAYNDAVGSLENRVLVTARRFPELGVLGPTDKEPPGLEQVDLTPRTLQAPELVGTGVPEVIEGPSPAAEPDELAAVSWGGGPDPDLKRRESLRAVED